MKQPEESRTSVIEMPQDLSLQLDCDLCNGREADYMFTSLDGDYVRCRECGLIYGNAEEGGLDQWYDRRYEQILSARKICKRSKRWHANASTRLRHFEKFRKTGNYLEIGCGQGDFLKVVDEAGWKAVGIEISETAAAHAREKHGLDLRTGVIEELADELPQESFDVIFADNLLEHLVSPNSFLEKSRQLLRPGGVLMIRTLNVASWAFRLSGSKWQYTYSAKIHRYVFSPETLKLYCRNHGLQIVKSTSFGFRFISKYRRRKWYYPVVRFMEQGVAAAAKLANQGHRIEIWVSR